MTRHPHQAPVTVFETNNPALLAVAQSLLEAVGIDFFVAGQVVAGQTPGGVIGSFGAPQIRVAPENARRARELLSELEG
jgi:hypothetical protein